MIFRFSNVGSRFSGRRRSAPITFYALPFTARPNHKSYIINHKSPRNHQSLIANHGFSLIEILVAVGILSFMIIGLLALFNQTSRAFRTGMTQSDVLESARSVSEMMGR